MNKIQIDNKIITITHDKDNYNFHQEDNHKVYNVEKGAYLRVYHYNFDCNSSIEINLNSENANVEYHYSTINYGNHNLKMVVNHNKKNTTSNIYNHGVNILNDKLHFYVEGIVKKDIEGCICNQENQIINLKDGNSTILQILLIDNYNVTSSHSAYIGKFKEDIIFYLMSRGIRKEQAIKLLISSLLINGGEEQQELINFKNKIENI